VTLQIRHARGEWRPFFENWPDGPDFQRLSPEARLVLYTFKLKLGRTGLRAIAGRHAALGEWTGLDPQLVRAAEQELEREGWMQFDGPIAWLVRGLQFEPTVSPNDSKHRKSVQAHLLTQPRRPILGRFMAHYPSWFPDRDLEAPLKALRSPLEAPSEGLPSPTPTPTPSPNPLKSKSDAAAAAGARDNKANPPENPPDTDPLRRFCDSPEVKAVIAAAGAKGGSAIEGYLRGSTDPPRLWMEIKSYLEGPAGPGGRAVTPVQLGDAMHAMAMANPPVPMGQRRLASFVRKVLEDLEPRPERPSGPGRRPSGDDFHAELLDAGKRLDAAAAEKRRTNV
jgi:hypothetical protein